MLAPPNSSINSRAPGGREALNIYRPSDRNRTYCFRQADDERAAADPCGLLAPSAVPRNSASHTYRGHQAEL